MQSDAFGNNILCCKIIINARIGKKKCEQVGKTTNTKMKPQRADDSWDVSS